MQRIDPLRRSWPLFDAEGSRTIERMALATSPPHSLMRRAGAAVARLGLAVAPHASSVWVAAGPGNNGGDGIEAALQLQAAGKHVHVSLLADVARLPADAADALARAQAAGVTITTALQGRHGGEDLVIDALLGLGTSRSPDGAIAAAIASITGGRRGEVLAVDLPSGLNASTGWPVGERAVLATRTIALLTLKPGLFTGAGRDHAGEVWLETLGIDTDAHAPRAWLSGGPEVARRSGRTHGQHKGSFGDVHVIGGAPSMVGAALLAARAALAAGAGRTHVSLLDGGSVSHDVVRPELMFRPAWWRSPPKALAAATVLCGCGGGDAVREALPPLLAHAGRLVLDADALNAVAADADLQQSLAARAAASRPTVLTPHPLEAARLLGVGTREVQADRLAAARELADRFACVVVLKGSGTVIASPGAASRVNPTGNAALATAGTGDVLGGWLAGLWAGAPDDSVATAIETAAQAVFRHGLAASDGQHAVDRPLRAGDLIERLHRAD